MLSVFPVGFLLDKGGLLMSIWVLAISGVIYTGLSLLTMFPIQVQLATFVVVAFFHAILFSTMATYVAVAFSFAHFGKLWGIVFLFGGSVNIGEYFLEYGVNTYLDHLLNSNITSMHV